MQLVVEPAGVADGLPVGVAAPQGRGVGATVRAGGSFTLGRALKEREMVIILLDKGRETEGQRETERKRVVVLVPQLVQDVPSRLAEL